jgi:hypothetical protein
MAISRYSPGRIIAVTIGLSFAGIVFGGLAGAVILAIVLVVSQKLDSLTEPRLFAIAATVGAMLGAVCAPIAGWLLLRYVPLGRAFAGLTVGTIVGGAIGWFLQVSADRGNALLIAATVGFLGAAVVLRLWHVRQSSVFVSSDDGAA